MTTNCSYCTKEVSRYAGVTPVPVFCTSECKEDYERCYVKPVPRKGTFRVGWNSKGKEFEVFTEDETTAQELHNFFDAAYGVMASLSYSE